MKIQTGRPEKEGTYVTYIDEGVSSYPEKKLLIWDNIDWWYPCSDQFYRGIVYGWIGPLPSPKIDNLKYSKKKYAITTEMGREFDSYKQGIFDTLEEALDCTGDNGDFIYDINTDGSKYQLAKWSDKKCKWLFKKADLKKNKYLKLLKNKSY